MMVPGFVGIVYQFCTHEVRSFTAGKYLHFTKSIMQNRLVQVTCWMLAFFTGSLLLLVLILPVTVLNGRFLGDIMFDVYPKYVSQAFFPWCAVLISSCYLLYSDRTALEFEESHLFDDIRLKRSWIDLFMQTNSMMASKLERRLLRAKVRLTGTGRVDEQQNIVKDLADLFQGDNVDQQARYLLHNAGTSLNRVGSGEALDTDSYESIATVMSF
mmetsp:Transcript_24967/g.45412  ORF Transcript_24967/g.45412 Transcript_24967/m.45412 type:complete len:214 (+) Transcript_24967:3-644(+)